MKPNWMRVTFATAVLLLLCTASRSQTPPPANGTAAAKAPLKIMVIPFHPIRYYFSDCDKNVSSASKMQVQDVRNNFRAGLDYATESGLEKKYEPINLFQLKDSVSKKMLEEFYSNVSYLPETPNGDLPKKQKQELKKLRESLSDEFDASTLLVCEVNEQSM